MKLHERFSKHKIKRRYRLSFQSENTLNELWSVKLTRIKVTVGIIITILALVSLISYIIVETPLKTLLPGYLKSELRNEYLLSSLKLDSLEQEIKSKTQYFNNLKVVLTDKVEESKENKASGSNLSEHPLDSLMNPTEREKEFIKKYDEDEKFNLSILTPLAAEGIVFATPIQGKVATANDEAFINGITVIAAKDAAISSIYDGTVIDITEALSGSVQITIQHPNGFISKYKGATTNLVNQGDKVRAAQRIGLSSRGSVGIELWHNGTPVNPQEYISF